MSEKRRLKESCSTDMSPTTILYSVYGTRFMQPVYWGWGGVPGVGWEAGWPGGCYTGYPGPAIPDPIFNIYLRLGPTHGRMKAI